jgi:hypothetical protein
MFPIGVGSDIVGPVKEDSIYLDRVVRLRPEETRTWDEANMSKSSSARQLTDRVSLIQGNLRTWSAFQASDALILHP